jgi:twitching motility two-component system response regulator PilH
MSGLSAYSGSAALATPHEQAMPRSGTRILIVDDSPTELAVLTTVLQHEGFEVFTARDGEDALDKLAAETPRLVLLDVVMPGKNGFSLCRQIRSDARFSRVPVILVTSKNQPSDRFWGLKQGASEYLVKPWTADELLQTVRRHL